MAKNDLPNIFMLAGILGLATPAFAQDEGDEGADTEGADEADEAPPPDEAPVPTPKKGKKGAAPEGDPQVMETHVVQGGDTLWDLCGKYLNSPWYWPKIWSYNPQLTNPHWIYPGNELRFYPSDDGAPTEVSGSMTLEGGESDEPSLPEPEDLLRTTAPVEVGRIAAGSVLRMHTGFVSATQKDLDGVITSAPEESQLLSDYQRAYVKFNSAVKRGEKYAVYRTVKAIEHPITGELIGYVVEIIAMLSVTDTSPQLATVMFDKTYRPVERGDVVGKVRDNFGRRVQPATSQADVKGYIVETLEGALTLLGDHTVVFIDRGSSQGVQVGNQFAVYHRGDAFQDTDSADLPVETVGKVMVIDVQENTSTAVVVKAAKDLSIGDKIESIKS
ncbi:MAG: LysM peptidoglycan-binding domain-containing protein [Deltaproteobacteria bacterium]|nr:LysM peptidoglycan-binding domain-containing protein [Deltaproteobacteria bacterium]